MTIEQLGRFKITGTLGQGAMGTVYRATDPLIERTVAIKTVACAGLSKEETEAFEQRFYREAKSAGRLNHPNIVTIHDVGRSENLAFIAMEYLSGQSLREVLDSGVVLPPERCVEIAAEVADGLAYSHENGIVHRDIKPANIMVLENGTVKIADFGVALLPTGSGTVDGTAFGSPKYMSPEQVIGKRVDGRSDIFSLGSMLYEMLTGHPPFDGESLTAVLYQVLHGTPPLPSSFNPELPRVFDRLLAKAMTKDPEKRYQSASEFAADLRKCRRRLRDAGKPAGAATAASKPPASPAPAAVAQPGMDWRRWSLAAVGALLIGGLAWFYLGKSSPAGAQVEAVQAAAGVGNEASTPPSAAVVTPAVQPVPVAETAAPRQEEVPPTPDVPAEGMLRLAIAPWGEVLVNGKMAGVSPPLTELRLSPGSYRIELRNTNFKPHRQEIEVVAGKSVRIKHKFQ